MKSGYYAECPKCRVLYFLTSSRYYIVAWVKFRKLRRKKGGAAPCPTGFGGMRITKLQVDDKE